MEDITRWREDNNFMFEWQEQYLTSERSKQVGYCLSGILFLSQEHKVHIFKLTCNVLFII